MEKTKAHFTHLAISIGLIAIALVLRSYLISITPLPPVNLAVPATPPKPLLDIPLAAIPYVAPTIQAYPAKAKKKASLPEVIQTDERQHLIASTEVKADDHPQEINTVINPETGESQTFVTRKPLPWLAWDTHGEVSLSAGIKNATPTARLQLRQGLFQVKALHVGGVASIDQPISPQAGQSTDYFAGVSAWIEW